VIVIYIVECSKTEVSDVGAIKRLVERHIFVEKTAENLVIKSRMLTQD
jgi:hypothetical protein